jgi:hypothetical protein
MLLVGFHGLVHGHDALLHGPANLTGCGDSFFLLLDSRLGHFQVLGLKVNPLFLA